MEDKIRRWVHRMIEPVQQERWVSWVVVPLPSTLTQHDVHVAVYSNGQLVEEDAVLLEDPDDQDLRSVGFTLQESEVSYQGPGSPDDV